MSAQRIATRYAKSLIDLAQEQNILEQIKNDVQVFADATQNRDFYMLLKSPIVSGDKKKSILKEIFGGKLQEMTMAFLNILVVKGRESFLPEIADEFQNQYRKLNNIIVAKLISATPVGKDTIEMVKAKILANSAADTKIELKTEVNPDLMGGFILEFDGKIYDASVVHKLETLKREFKDNLYVSQIMAI